MTDSDEARDDPGALGWPANFDRTPPQQRKAYPGGFRVTRSTAFQNILDELATWNGVRDVQLDSGAEHTVRNPNKPYADATFDDPGVVVRFTKDGDKMAAACDRWDSPRDNAQDLFHYLHETRMMEQRGTVTGESEYDKLRLPSGDGEAVVAESPPHEILGVPVDASEGEVRTAYRARLMEVHPDHGGSEAAFQRVKAAKEALES